MHVSGVPITENFSRRSSVLGSLANGTRLGVPALDALVVVAQAQRHAHVPAGLLGGGAGVGVVVGDVDGPLRAHPDRVLRRVLGHVRVEDPAELAQPLDRHAEAAGQEVKAAAHGGLDGIGALGRHPDGRVRLLHRLGEDGGLGDLVVLAVVAERLAGQREQDDVDGFLPARAALAQVLTEAFEFVALVAAAEADVEAPALSRSTVAISSAMTSG